VFELDEKALERRSLRRHETIADRRPRVAHSRRRPGNAPLTYVVDQDDREVSSFALDVVDQLLECVATVRRSPLFPSSACVRAISKPLRAA
jgi:hypothetical protein